MTSSNALPSAAEAMARAVDHAQRDQSRGAEVWLAIAKELREGHQPPPRTPDRLTLHDIEGIVCKHARVAVRRRGGPGEWFLHTDDATACDTPDADNEHRRRVTDSFEHATGGMWASTADVTTRMDLRETETTTLNGRAARVAPYVSQQPRTLPDDGQCVHCGCDIHLVDLAIREAGKPLYRHDGTDQSVCPIGGQTPEGDETFVHTFAWPVGA